MENNGHRLRYTVPMYFEQQIRQFPIVSKQTPLKRTGQKSRIKDTIHSEP